MPKCFIRLQHLKQSREYTCVPTSVRMVLGYYGDEKTEVFLEHLLGCTLFGTTAQSVISVTRLGSNVDLRYSSMEELKAFLEAGYPAIAFVRTGELDYWQNDCPHAVVVVGYDDNYVYINDPYFEDAPQKNRIETFQLAWRKTRNRLAIIKPE